MLQLHQRLEENVTLTKGLCNIPHALVHLLTMDDKPAWVSQYVIAASLSKAVDDQIDTRAKEGTIELAPLGCCWNSPLMLTKTQKNSSAYWI